MADESSHQPGGVDQLQLALDRTYLAHERTLMAWVRTATSLITFGFTLYKLFLFLREQEGGVQPERLLGARIFGLVMILIGIVTLAIAAWQHSRAMKRLRVAYPDAPWSLSLVVAALIAALGVLALAAIAY